MSKSDIITSSPSCVINDFIRDICNSTGCEPSILDSYQVTLAVNKKPDTGSSDVVEYTPSICPTQDCQSEGPNTHVASLSSIHTNIKSFDCVKRNVNSPKCLVTLDVDLDNHCNTQADLLSSSSIQLDAFEQATHMPAQRAECSTTATVNDKAPHRKNFHRSSVTHGHQPNAKFEKTNCSLPTQNTSNQSNSLDSTNILPLVHDLLPLRYLIKPADYPDYDTLQSCERIIDHISTEVIKRVQCMYNAIVFNVPDSTNIKTLKNALLKACEIPDSHCTCKRLRKSSANTSCPIMFEFNSIVDASRFVNNQHLFRKASSFKNVRIIHDRTPIQRRAKQSIPADEINHQKDTTGPTDVNTKHHLNLKRSPPPSDPKMKLDMVTNTKSSISPVVKQPKKHSIAAKDINKNLTRHARTIENPCNIFTSSSKIPNKNVRNKTLMPGIHSVKPDSASPITHTLKSPKRTSMVSNRTDTSQPISFSFPHHFNTTSCSYPTSTIRLRNTKYNYAHIPGAQPHGLNRLNFQHSLLGDPPSKCYFPRNTLPRHQNSLYNFPTNQSPHHFFSFPHPAVMPPINLMSNSLFPYSQMCPLQTPRIPQFPYAYLHAIVN
ncbi:unnamed protein product [Trichobilharzia szidati]|nr:unnamed protein product [Trichobilharzia szidati]